MNIPLVDALEALRMIAEREVPNQNYDFCDCEFAASFLEAAKNQRTGLFLEEQKAMKKEEQ